MPEAERRTGWDLPLILLLFILLALTPWPLGSRFVWAGLGIAAMLFAAAIPWLVSERPTSLLRKYPATVPMLAFLLWVTLAWLTGRSAYPYGTEVKWLQLASYALVSVVVANLASSRGRVRDAMGLMILASAVAVHLFAIYQWTAWDGRMIWNYEPPFGGTSPFGPFNNRNHYAGYTIATMGPAAGLALLGRGKWRLAGVGATSLGIVGLLLSLSRSGFLAMLVLLATVVLVASSDRWAGSGWRQRSRSAAIAIILVALVGGVVFGALSFLEAGDVVTARLATLTRPFTDRSATGRIQIWHDTIPMIAARPIAGWGLNTFAWSHLRFRSTGDDSLPQHAHNEYLEITAETGLVGAAICVWFLWLLLGQMRRRIREAEAGFERAIRVGCLASWVGILALAMTDFPTVIPATNLVLAVTAAIGSAAWTPRGPSAPAD